MMTQLFLALVLAAAPLAVMQEATTPPGGQQSGATIPSSSAVGAADANGGGVGAPAGNASPLRVGGPVKAPKAIKTPDPDYPAAARNAGYCGTVVLWLIVDRDGSPKQIKVVRPMGMGLDEAAIAAVEKWQFKPATRNGEPVPVQINVEVNFRFDASTPPVIPLHSSREASATPAQFPGADITKYPLVAHIQNITVSPAGLHYRVEAELSFDRAENAPGVAIFCESNKKDCSFLLQGHYPARWLVANQQLEILGQKGNGTEWEKAEYKVAPAKP